MKVRLVPVVLVIDVSGVADEEGHVADAVNETLRGCQRSFSAGSALVDYAFLADADRANLKIIPNKAVEVSDVYVEGEAFGQALT